MPVPFVDLGLMHDEIRDELDLAWRETVSSSGFIGGEAVTAFEDEWSRYCWREHAIGVANGTDAIEIALRASGIASGDEVIVPANTFIATVEAVLAVGGRPVFVDVDEDTLLATPNGIADAITSRTAAIIVVHLFGQVVPMDDIVELAETHGLLLVEDAAQAHGATWRGRPAGSFGHVATFSFYPGKNLGAFGDGGAIVTDNPATATLAREIANHGSPQGARYRHTVLGRNSRLDALQARILSAKLRRLDHWNALRRRAAQRYNEALAGLDEVRTIRVPDEVLSAHHLYPVRVPERDAVRDALDAAGIGVGIHYPVPCHLHPPYTEYAMGPFPVAEHAANSMLSLPMYPHITDAQVDATVAALQSAIHPSSARTSVLSVPGGAAES